MNIPNLHPGMVDQASARYRRGYPMRQCSVCTMYWHRDNGALYGGCTKITGDITPYGLCDYFRRLNNPFGNRLTSAHRDAMEQIYNHAHGYHSPRHARE
jgi:hypothetical protein